MKSILALMCLCFIGVSSVYGASQKVWDFINYVAGEFDNEVQTQQPGDNHEFIQARFVPVDLKCFQSEPVFFLEEGSNNVLRLFYLAAPTDGIEDTVSVTYYNFTDYTKYKPGEFTVESLFNIPCEDFHTDPECKGSFRVAREGFTYENMPHCSYTVNGKHPRFTSMFDCDSLTVTLPMYAQQASPMSPYEFQRRGQKYPLIKPPTDYVPPCSN